MFQNFKLILKNQKSLSFTLDKPEMSDYFTFVLEVYVPINNFQFNLVIPMDASDYLVVFSPSKICTRNIVRARVHLNCKLAIKETSFHSFPGSFHVSHAVPYVVLIPSSPPSFIYNLCLQHFFAFSNFVCTYS